MVIAAVCRSTEVADDGNDDGKHVVGRDRVADGDGRRRRGAALPGGGPLSLGGARRWSRGRDGGAGGAVCRVSAPDHREVPAAGAGQQLARGLSALLVLRLSTRRGRLDALHALQPAALPQRLPPVSHYGRLVDRGRIAAAPLRLVTLSLSTAVSMCCRHSNI